MRNGDLSNMGGYLVGFRLDTFLVKRQAEEARGIRKAFGISGKSRYRVDPHVMNLMDILYKDTEYNIALLYKEDADKAYFEDILDLYGGADSWISFRTPTDIYTKLATAQIHFYVDNDEFIDMVSHPHAVYMSTLSALLRRRHL